MKRTKLRFLFTPIWIINIYVQFGLLYSILPKTDGKLSLRWLSTITLLLLFSIILIKDVFIFRRVIFLRIIGFALLVFSAIYTFFIIKLMNQGSIVYLALLIPTIFTGIYILKNLKSIKSK